ncbi:hypothetical protein DRN45_03380 [Thermococci archaeon]|nr:MAG: hypothetical protein DRN45_03380 [Thermococci archaeon]
MQRKFLGICGILAPVIAFIAISLSIYMHPWFSWRENALSDLGALGVTYNTIFNMGLIVTALVSLIFASGLPKITKDKIGRAGNLFFVISIVFLLLIGIFPESTSPHKSVSVAFYTFATVSLVLIGIGLMRKRSERKYGLFTVLLLGTALFLCFGFSWPAIAVPEIIGAGAIGIWSIVFGLRILYGQ